MTACFPHTSKADGNGRRCQTTMLSSALFQSLLSSCHSAPGVRESVSFPNWRCSGQRAARLCLLTALSIPDILPDFFSYFKVYQTLGRQHQSLFLLSSLSYRKPELLEASKLGKERGEQRSRRRQSSPSSGVLFLFTFSVFSTFII